MSYKMEILENDWCVEADCFETYAEAMECFDQTKQTLVQRLESADENIYLVNLYIFGDYDSDGTYSDYEKTAANAWARKDEYTGEIRYDEYVL